MPPQTPARIVPVATLVLCPEEIFNHNSIFNSLHIRQGATVPFEMFPLDEIQIERHFGKYSAEGKQLLARFNDDDIAFEVSQLKKRHAREKSGMPLEKFLDKTVARYIQELLTNLLNAVPDLRSYHRVKNPATGNYLIARCNIFKEAPVLSFEVVRTADGGLSVLSHIRCGNTSYTLDQVKRYKFLVEAEGNYYSLRHNDHLTLEWLEQSQPQQFAHNPVLLSQRIVQKLEEGYQVNRNNLFEKKEIDTAPVNCVYLSEISDSMLMFTPKWKYEGIIVEGEWKERHETIRNGEAYSIIRDKEAELQFTQYLQSLHPNFAKQSNKFFYLTFVDAKKKQWFLKAYHGLLEQDAEMIGLEMLRHFRYSAHAPATEMLIIKQEEETLTLSLKIRFDKEQVSLTELQKLLIAGQNSILLKDSTIGIFNDEWIAQYAPIIKHGKLSKSEVVIPQWIMLSLEKGAAKEVLEPSISKEWLQRWLQWQDEQQTVYTVPTLLQASLRPYQHKGYEWLSLLAEIGAGACLADDMGLGKTLQTITFLCRRLEQEPTAHHLIICPASLIYNWKMELEKFAPSVKAFVYNGLQRNIESFFRQQGQVLICSYGTLRSDIEQLHITPWDAVVVDESQNIKNVQAQITKAVQQLSARARVALSGTPVMNNTFDLYAQLNFLLPGLFGGQEFFRKEYANPIDRDGDKEKIKALQQMTAPFVLRRTKEQVATDLPEKTESVLWCAMGEDQMAAYNAVKNQIRDSIFLDIRNGGLEKNKLNILQGILKLRQVCGSPQLLSESSDCIDSIKVDMLMDELLNLKNNKTLVFSQFKGMLHLIADRCRKQNISFFHFDGDTPIADRQAMVNRFQSAEDQTRVFLISLKSGNAGLNLTAADYVFLVDPWWNTAVQQQAIDRTHRIGQTKNVFAYKMICKDTIEERIIELQQKKRLLSEELISAEEGFVKNLTEDDVAYLFG
ncbi:DEAD/DEAH box helicase [Taibaiella koreensis]|uniref:DEAD/DEAH box helicase n=1 Tax=Taibaiella koreensis TaxID=1268548 RepID=UPI000E5A0687|nr:DEAD/DEAH box helicase [Taibaiella koreensis]